VASSPGFDILKEYNA